MKYNKNLLIDEAKKASENAYAPYSNYKVGAALLTKKGNIFTGCNVENSSYSMTICAERNAVFNAVNNGEKDFEAIAIFVDDDTLFSPCGACRQVLSEFNEDISIIIKSKKEEKITSLSEIFKLQFGLQN